VKIVHLLGWYFPDSVGGTEIYVAELCRRLRAEHHDVSVAAPIANGTTCEYVHDGVDVFRFAIPSPPTRDEATARVPVRGSEQLTSWIAAQRPDWLHVHSFTTGVGIHEIRAARSLGVRVIATCHLPGFGYMCRAGELMRWGVEPCDGIVERAKCSECNLARVGVPRTASRLLGRIPTLASTWLGWLPGPMGTMLGMPASIGEYERRQHELLELVDHFVVLNETARRMLAANGSDLRKIVVNRLGVVGQIVHSKPRRAERAAGAPVRFGYIGRLHPTKGLLTLARAVRLTPGDVTFTVDIHGPVLDDATRAFMTDVRQAGGGDPRLTFGPAVARADVPSTLAGFDALLCPSTWYENGPTVALEAQAVGTPVIGSAAGNLAEIIVNGDNGRLVAPGDAHAWSMALADVAREPRIVDRWRTRLPPVRTMDDVADDYLKLYAA